LRKQKNEQEKQKTIKYAKKRQISINNRQNNFISALFKHISLTTNNNIFYIFCVNKA